MSEILIQRLDVGLPVPERAHAGDAGIDLRSSVDIVLHPGERATVPAGIAVAIPFGYAGFVQPRSGMASKQGLGIVNTPGLIDSGYRGEVRVIVINLDPRSPIEIHRGDKIAQLVVLEVPDLKVLEVDELPPSERAERGFGSSGR